MLSTTAQDAQVTASLLKELQITKAENARLRNENSRLRFQANTDALTGLGNRRAFDQEIVKQWAEACYSQQPISVLVVDIDHFKSVNDTHGHHVGDQLLAKIGQAIKKSVRGNDYVFQVEDETQVFRAGGEEFYIILKDCDFLGACEVAERIRARCKPHRSVSIGVHGELPPLPRNGWAEAMNKADKALYTAKQGGRDKVCVA